MPEDAPERLRADDWVGWALADQWRILEVAGRWGPGLRFDAEATDDGRPARVWIVPVPPSASERDLERRRAALRRLTEPPPPENSLPMLAWGEEDDPPVLWLVAEAEPPLSLAAVLARYGQLHPTRAAQVGLDVVAALDAAHEREVYHLGLSPEAVWLPEGGEGPARVFGFGVGAELTAADGLAPEFSGRTPPDQRTDIWGLGRLLEACVDAPPPRLAALTRWCCQVDPTRRPPSLAAVRSELQAVRAGRGELGPFGLSAVSAPLRRQAWLALLGLAAGVTLCLLLALALGRLPVRADLERAKAALTAGDAAAAVLAFESAAGRAPDLAEAQLGLAKAREALGMHVAAVDAWRRYLALRPDAATAQLALGRLLLLAGDGRSALGHAAEAARRSPADEKAHRLHAEALEANGDLAGAGRALERAVALSPSDPELHARLGAALASVPEQRQRALEAFKEALRLDPARPRRRLGLADFLADRLGDCEAAAAQYQALLDRGGRHRAAAEHGLGRCLARSGGPPEAATKHLEDAVRLQPTNARFRLTLARHQRDVGNGCAAAAEAFAAATRLSPRDVVVLTEAGACWRELGDWCAARTLYQALRALEPESPEWPGLEAEAGRRCR